MTFFDLRIAKILVLIRPTRSWTRDYTVFQKKTGAL